jgi:hypothetical protein
MGTGGFSSLAKQLEHYPNHSPVYSPKVKSAWSNKFASHTSSWSGAYLTRTTLPLFLCFTQISCYFGIYFYSEIADEEVIHLFASSDDDHDDLLTFDEILDHHEIFVGSEATDYGDHLHNIHIFQDEL